MSQLQHLKGRINRLEKLSRGLALEVARLKKTAAAAGQAVPA
jgi:hypothetical protein